MTEADLIAALAERFKAPTYAFLSHVRNGTGYSRKTVRTADALAMGLWPSRGLELHGFEVKVSRSDWLRELKEAEKAEAIARFCHRWWMVVADDSIVQDGELPPAWGLLVFRDGKLVTKTEAPRTEAEPPDYVFLAAILRRATEGMVPASAVNELALKRIKESEKSLQLLHERELTRRLESHRAAEEAIREFEAASGIKITRWDAGRVGAAVRLILEGGMRGRRLQLERMATEAEDVARRLREVIAEQLAEEAAT